MKSTERFKETIQKYLEEKAGKDPLFMNTYLKENKNIDDCITYILNTVKNSGIAGYADDEIYSMAVHYYDEDDIKTGNKITNANIVVNHHIELTEEEKEEARKKAKEKAEKEQYDKITKKQKPVQTSSDNKIIQQSLF